MPNLIGDIFSLNDTYERKTTTVDVAAVEVQAMTGLTITASSGTGAVATLTYAAQTVAPFAVGSVIAVFGHAPLAYNGTYRVRTCTTTQVTYDSTATGALTTGGTVLLVTESTAKGDFWTNLNSHGWFGGGSPGPVSTVDRIDFSNDSSTASARGPLSLARFALSATGNSNYGWFGGGVFTGPVPVSSVDRIDFSNDSSTASVRGPLSLARYSLVATGNSNYGWFGGGFPGPVSTVDRIDFSNDSSTASVRGPLSDTKYRLAATGNSNYGWFGGGFVAAIVSTVDRIDFSNDSSTASVRGPLSSVRYSLVATGNSNYGWFGGGNPGPVSTVDRIDFSNDSSTASVRGPLSLARQNLAATGNSNYGWFGGGFIAGLGAQSSVDRIDFSNDSTTASVRDPLSSARYVSTATSGQAKSSSIRPLKGGNFGWFGGGNVSIPTSASVSTVDRINFSNDSVTASVRGPLTSVRYNAGATGNSNYGWFGGGNPGSRSSVDRIDFSNDSLVASPRGFLSFGRSGGVPATGNFNYGWFGGGAFPPSGPLSIVDRINFSNDLSRASARSPLNQSKLYIGATGNSNYGWFGGGAILGSATVFSTVERIDFSNDYDSVLLRGPLSLNKEKSAATGNSNYGWFGGGSNFPTTLARSEVDRIDFSNDSVTASSRGRLSSIRFWFTATGNSDYGWFGGGSQGSPLGFSTVDRLNFSNDSVTLSLRGRLSSARYRLTSSVSNTQVG